MSGSIASRRNYSTCRIYTSRLPPRPEPGRDWVAQELRQTCHADRRLLDVMLKVAAEAVRQVVEDDHPGLRIGMIYTCHTFGRDLGFKPYVHLVIPTQYSDPVRSLLGFWDWVTKGGLNRDNAWIEVDAIPGGKLAAKWRYLLCKELRRLRPHDTDLRATIDKIYRKYRGFQVYTDSFYPKGLEAAKYIGRYLGHPPLATSHITQYHDPVHSSSRCSPHVTV